MEFNGTFLASIISFLVFVYLMNKVLYAPILKVVTERREFIDGNYNAADLNNKKADELSLERDEKLVGAKNDARINYVNSLNGFKEQKANIIQEAQKNVDEELNQAFVGLNNLSNEAKESLKGRMSELANDIVEKVLGYRSEVQGFDNDAVDRILYH